MAMVRTVDRIRRNLASEYGIASMVACLSRMLYRRMMDREACALWQGGETEEGVPGAVDSNFSKLRSRTLCSACRANLIGRRNLMTIPWR